MSSTSHLDDTINDLRAQIDALDPADTVSRQHLTALLARVEKTHGTAGDPTDRDALNENMNASVLQFEASHPRIAAVLNQLAEKLGTMGI